MKNFSLLLIILLMGAMFALVANNAIEKNEKIECEKLQELSKAQSNFYWTDWQIEMCNYAK